MFLASRPFLILLDFLYLPVIALLFFFVDHAVLGSLHLQKLLWFGDLGESLRVGLEKNLPWGLAEFGDLDLEGISLYWVLQGFQVDPTLVGDWVKHVEILNRALLDSENQIYPLVNVLGYKARLQSLPVFL